MKILITGGAGFVGSNAASEFAAQGHSVTIVDDLSRLGASRNRPWLAATRPEIEFVRADVRDAAAMDRVVPGHDAIIHLAAQVAVTTSVSDPRHDFETNALGTFNVLEAARKAPTSPAVVFTSTNKVYGGLEDVPLAERAARYEATTLPQGVDESRPLDLHSPYGCSKGAADQYVHDYGRIYGLATTVLRMSCIYGTRQFGTEDQGWLAHFAISWLQKRPVTIYGDGKQVRDALFITDLVDAMRRVLDRRSGAGGQIFNIGGGPANTLSVLELVRALEAEFGYTVPTSFGGARPGDQKYYVSDIRKARRVLGWEPQVSTKEGVARLVEWIRANAGPS